MADQPDDDALRERYLPRLREELAALRAASADTAEARKPVELDQQSV
ncbi:TraR/DksA family transcriptional regulator, partial [Halovulum dunhuangense]|nr:TraR/DksA family transcriptional regulator [Halovulum dunhuangense]